jgi:pyrroloquinoline-quinone synthase
MKTLTALDALIASRSLLLHPFYVRWSKGELTLQELQIYAKEYYALVTRIPGIVAKVLEKAPAAKKGAIAQNVLEETEHIELWERFAKSLEISKEELVTYQPSDDVMSAVRSLEEAAERSYEDGVVAIYALERELPAIAQTKKEGLLRYYGLSSPDAQAYFDEHLGEEKHLAVWRDVSVNDEQAFASAEVSMAAQNKVLDGVCHAAGIPLLC